MRKIVAVDGKSAGKGRKKGMRGTERLGYTNRD